MKLRLLNGSHSTLAYLGFLLGHEFVWQASRRSGARARSIERQMTEEIVPTLAQPAGRRPRAPTAAQLLAALPQRGAAAPHAADRDGRLAKAAAAPARHGARAARGRRADRASAARDRRAGSATRAAPTSEGSRIDVSGSARGDVRARSSRDAARRPGASRRRLSRSRERVRRTISSRTARSATPCAAVTSRSVRRRRPPYAGASSRRRVTATPERSQRHGHAIPSHLHPDRLFPGRSRQRASLRARSTRRSRTCRSSARTATPIRSGSPTTTPFAERRRALHHARPLRVPHALQPGRARSRTSAFRARGRRRRSRRTRARSGARSPRTITCFAARRRACGSTTRSTTSSACDERLTHRIARTASSTASTRASRDARVPAARAVRALQHRGDRDDRVAARSARRITRRSATSGWKGRVVTAYRPDPVVDPEFDGFAANVAQFGALARREHRDVERAISPRTATVALSSRRWARRRPITAIRPRRRPTCRPRNAQRLLDRALAGTDHAAEAEAFRGQMLTEMARMSLDDGLVMQIHPGSFRNHNPQRVRALRPRQGRRHPDAHRLRARAEAAARPFGNERDLTIILFTLDETSYARELAPLAGHYPVLKLGPPWWFHDSPEGMLRFREQATETAGFYNTVGFNDDTRAFLSIPARHDVARRIDCRFLATLVDRAPASTRTRRSSWRRASRTTSRRRRTSSDR